MITLINLLFLVFISFLVLNKEKHLDIKSWFLFFIVFIILNIPSIIIYYKNKSYKRFLKISLYFCGIFYIIFLLDILFLNSFRKFNILTIKNFKNRLILNTNLMPFKTISNYLNNKNINRSIIFKNIFGNLVLFFPIGLLIPFWFKNIKVKSVLFFSIIVIFSIEILQFVLGTGSLDIDDLILNTLGFLIAYSFSKIFFIKEKGR